MEKKKKGTPPIKRKKTLGRRKGVYSGRKKKGPIFWPREKKEGKKRGRKRKTIEKTGRGKKKKRETDGRTPKEG